MDDYSIDSNFYKYYLQDIPPAQSPKELSDVEKEHMLTHMRASMLSNVEFTVSKQEPLF